MGSDSEYYGLPLIGVNSSWPIMTLENICDGIFDCPHSTPKLSNDGYYMVRTQDIRKGFFDTQNAVKISKESYIQRTKRAKPQYGDLLFSREGTYFGDAAEVPPKIDLCLGQRMVVLRPCPEIIHPTFLRIWINSKSFQIHLRSFRDGTVAERLNMSTIRKLPVPVPSLEIQSQVISLIVPLEKKDALNRQMNATLEGMTQALFKSWFVDFDPVIDNALAAGNPIPEAFAARAETRRKALADGTANRDVAKQFPAAFQFTEGMGWIPDKWEAGSIGDIASVMGGFAFKSQAFLEKGFPVIKIKNIVGDGTVSTEKAQCIGTEDAKKTQKFSLNDGDLLMAMTGATVGKIGIVVNGNKDAFLNQRVAKLEGKDIQNFSPFLFCFFKNQANFDQIVGIAGGSAQPNISSSEIQSVQCVKPEKGLLVKFIKAVNPSFERWVSNYKVSKTLSNLRDTLLPKLISGEIRIPEAERITEEALS